MPHEAILNRVIALFAAITEIPEVTEESDILEDLELSSMDVLFLLTSLEEEFHIPVPERMIRKVVTVGDVADMMEGLIQKHAKR